MTLPIRAIPCALMALCLVTMDSKAATTRPSTSPVKVTVGASGDLGTDLVVQFYRLLLQEQPPTREQELALLGSRSSIRMVLALKPEDYLPDEGLDPLTRTPRQKENHRRRMEKIDAAGPVVLDYLRVHRQWFIPENMRSANQIRISTMYHWRGDLEKLSDPPRPDYGWVRVFFVEGKASEGTLRIRTLVFPISAGRIDADGISFDEGLGELFEERLGRLRSQ